ncbi:MAG: hypothetical protein ACRDZ4_02025 [Egibacteraceae bacterium]
MTAWRLGRLVWLAVRCGPDRRSGPAVRAARACVMGPAEPRMKGQRGVGVGVAVAGGRR